MENAEYETAKKYDVSGLEVVSEVVKDEHLGADQSQRSLLIRSSCKSERWGARTQDHSYTCPAKSSQFEAEFERVRYAAAETLAKTESGELPENRFTFLAAEIHGPNGKKITAAAVADLSRGPTLLGPEFIQLLELRQQPNFLYEDLSGSMNRVPLFEGRITFGSYDVTTTVAPSEHGVPACILGGDFFQQALRDRQNLIQEILMPEHYRTLANAARCKKSYVLITGKYGEHRVRLEQIKQALLGRNLTGLILDEYPDIEEQSLAEKMVTYASICRFVIVDDAVPSGHINELGICHERKFITAVLRFKGQAATAMQADIGKEVSFIKVFDYFQDADFQDVVVDAAQWADSAVNERAKALNREYTWRSPERIMR